MPTSPTTGRVELLPPPLARPFPRFILVLCPAFGGSNCLERNFTTTSCDLAGLTPDTTYSVTAVAVDASGVNTPPSSRTELAMPPPFAPALMVAMPWGPTTATATAVPPPGVTFNRYTFTATPVGGGLSVTTVSDVPYARFRGLTPATQYEFSAVGTLPDGRLSPASNTLPLIMPSAGSPVIASVTPITSTTVIVVLNPPFGLDRPVSGYEVRLCATNGNNVCVTHTCTNNVCRVADLREGAMYHVSAVALVGADRMPASNTLQVTMPDLGTPALVSTQVSSTSVVAIVAPPIGMSFNWFMFSIQAAGSDAVVTVTRATPEAALNGLKPGTTYTLVVTAERPDGSTTPFSNALTFVTPAFGAPSLTSEPLGPTQANVSITPPAIGGPWVRYNVTLCPVGPGGCVAAVCTDPTSCLVGDLKPETSYVAQVIALANTGQASALSNEALLTTLSQECAKRKLRRGMHCCSW